MSLIKQHLHTLQKQQDQMFDTHRFITFREAVDFLMDNHNMTNQQATHFIWDNQFTMGTDRAIWLTVPSELGC